MLAVLPEWLDADRLRTIAAVLALIAAAGVVLVLARVRDPARRAVGVLLLVVAAGGLLWYRAELERCARDCDCRLLFDDVPVDGCPAG